MKRIFKILILLVFLGGFGFLVTKLIQRVGHKESSAASIRQLPSFHFNTMDGALFTDKQLQEGKPVVFIYFNTTCDHCQYEAREISGNISRFANSTVLMISAEPGHKLRAFDSTYQLTRHANIQLLRDGDNQFYNTFSTRMIPAIFIYDGKGKLVKQYLGEVKMEAIYKYL